MVFLPEEVSLSTRHVIMLGPGERPRRLRQFWLTHSHLEVSTRFQYLLCGDAATSMVTKRDAGTVISSESEPDTSRIHPTPLKWDSSQRVRARSSDEQSSSAHLGAAAISGASTLFPRRCLQQRSWGLGRDTDEPRKLAEDSTTAPGQTEDSSLITPWRYLRLQQPSYRWQWSAFCDSTRQSDFAIAITLLDLQQAAALHPVAEAPLFLETVPPQRGSMVQPASAISDAKHYQESGVCV